MSGIKPYVFFFLLFRVVGTKVFEMSNFFYIENMGKCVFNNENHVRSKRVKYFKTLVRTCCYSKTQREKTITTKKK